MPDSWTSPAENTTQDTASRQAVILFLRAPEKGKVKTRLAQAIGQDAALNIYRNFVRDTLAMLKKSGRSRIICFHPASAEKAVIQWLCREDVFWPQTGDDLGERMANAFTRAFSANYSRAILMGTDIPDLPESVIGEALDALARHPAVLGPATDGGYYLIGFNRRSFSPRFFRGIAWSSPAVFTQTIQKMNAQNVSCHILPEWRDIDDWDDLKNLAQHGNRISALAPSTFACLADLGLLPDIETSLRRPPGI